MGEYASQLKMDATFKITLPNKAKSNNATSVDGNTYIWDLTKTQNLELSFTIGNDNSKIIIIGGICGAAIIICGCALVISKKKKAN